MEPTTGSLMPPAVMPCVSASLSQNATPSGWTIGGGTELALGPNWSAKLEYLYVDLGTVNNTVMVTGVASLTDSARIQMNVVRAGVQLSLLEHDPEKWIPIFREDHAQRTC